MPNRVFHFYVQFSDSFIYWFFYFNFILYWQISQRHERVGSHRIFILMSSISVHARKFECIHNTPYGVKCHKKVMRLLFGMPHVAAKSGTLRFHDKQRQILPLVIFVCFFILCSLDPVLLSVHLEGNHRICSVEKSE